MELTGNFLAQIFPLLILIAVGFLLLLIWGFWISSRRASKRGRESRNRQADDTWNGAAETESTQPAEVVATEPATTAPGPQPSSAAGDDSVEVFRVLRDLADGSLMVEIDGQRFHRLIEITDAQMGRRFVANARALGHFAMLLKGPPPPAPPVDAAVAAPPPAAPEPSPAAPPPPPAAASPTDSQDGEPEAEMINVAEQIESLLQFRLAMDPQLARRSIHVRPGFKGGVRIVVDEKSYDGVDEIPDEEVRAFLQATIQEWNARN